MAQYIDYGFYFMAMANIARFGQMFGQHKPFMNNVSWPWPIVLIMDFFFGP